MRRTPNALDMFLMLFVITAINFTVAVVCSFVVTFIYALGLLP